MPPEHSISQIDAIQTVACSCISGQEQTVLTGMHAHWHTDMHTCSQGCVNQHDILEDHAVKEGSYWCRQQPRNALERAGVAVSQKTYGRLSQSTSPEVSAALVVQTTLLGVLFFNDGSSRLVR